MASVNRPKIIATTKKKLDTFLANNPYSAVELLDKFLIISKPWNDESLVLGLFPKVRNTLVEILNSIILPPRFTAIYHIDTNTMEYIFTRLKADDPIMSRQFTFNLDNKQYSCKFDKASERLMTLVDNYARAGDSKTEFRNLPNLDEIRRELTNIITSPDIHSNPDKYLARVLETMEDARLDDETKVRKLIETTCKPDVIFKEIEQNKTYFSNKQEFEGGFAIEPLVSGDTTFESFRAMCHPKIADGLRFIRNALVHGHEKRSGRVINPTPKNDILIMPWCCVARRIAEQVVLFG